MKIDIFIIHEDPNSFKEYKKKLENGKFYKFNNSL